MSEAGREGRAIIDEIGGESKTTVGCGAQFFSGVDASCQDTCPTGTVVANDQEKADLRDASSDAVDVFIDNSAGFVLKKLSPSRDLMKKLKPTQESVAVSMLRPIQWETVQVFVPVETPEESARVFVTTTPGPEVLLNDQLGNLFNWCNVEIDDGLTGPNCQFVAQDAQGNQFRFNPS